MSPYKREKYSRLAYDLFEKIYQLFDLEYM